MPEEESHTPFIRWQQLTITEMGKVINLLLTITIATLGFVVTQLIKNDFEFKNCWDHVFLVVGTSLLLINIIIILQLNLNRLKDFKKTAKITKVDSSNDKASLREETKVLGEKTWNLFNCSLWIFGIAESLIVIGFAIQILLK